MSWGGAREGAGRPARGPVPSEPHKKRPPLAARHPVHVIARFVTPAPAPSTRTPPAAFARSDTYRALRRALAVSFARCDFRIVHLAIRRDRLELVVEADDKHALARGMQGFQVSAAKWLNRFAQRRGRVFADRYRSRILKTRTDVRALVGSISAARTSAWPQTWLLRIELSRPAHSRRAARRHLRRWIRSRADEDS